jgi:hypothetical protein
MRNSRLAVRNSTRQRGGVVMGGWAQASPWTSTTPTSLAVEYGGSCLEVTDGVPGGVPVRDSKVPD